jgi:DNA-binding GntR family transcriptional regulator
MLRSSLQARIVDSVLEHIAAQGFGPGARLKVDSIARDLGVSRSPVQAAFDYLAQQGILEARRHRGFLVKRIADRPPAPQSRGFELYDRIIADMAQGALAGSVSESALMRRYGVDRGELGPVLRRLNHEGLATPSLGRGWVFIEFSLDVVLQSYQLRQLIEPGYIVSRAFAPDTVRLEALRRDHESIIERLSPATTFEETFAPDARFHQTLAEFTGNRFFIETMRTQTNIRRLSEYLGRTRLENVRVSFIDHLNMINALLHNEREWAAALMRRHLSQSNDRAARYYPADMEEIRHKEPPENGTAARKRK